jgi:hypothetical protein
MQIKSQVFFIDTIRRARLVSAIVLIKLGNSGIEELRIKELWNLGYVNSLVKVLIP